MIILCTHNDGGVGKTTLAIHATGILAARSESILLVDCDDQADSWQFYTGRIPGRPQEMETEDYKTIISNKHRESVKKLAKLQEYDHIILDIDSPLQSTVQVIVGNDPDLILVPVNKSQKAKALRNLPRTLKVISQLSKPGFSPEVIIVPLGVARDTISYVVDKIDYENKPQNCQIAASMPDLQEEMQVAIYEDRKYIWNYQGYEHLYDYFCTLIQIQRS